MLFQIEACKLHPEAIIPTRTNNTDVGLDLYAIEDVFIPLGTTAKVATGIALNIPVNYIGKVEDRSGMALKGLKVGGGIIDPGYNGDISVVLNNLTFDKNSTVVKVNDSTGLFPYGETKTGYQVKKGDRIAQILTFRVDTPEVQEVKSLWGSERGSNGFSSSGR